jgi:hypothetical protein
MDWFNCNGMLWLTIHDSHLDIVHLTLAHDVHHIPYCKISLTDMVKDLIRNCKNSVPQEVRERLSWMSFSEHSGLDLEGNHAVRGGSGVYMCPGLLRMG